MSMLITIQKQRWRVTVYDWGGYCGGLVFLLLFLSLKRVWTCNKHSLKYGPVLHLII